MKNLSFFQADLETKELGCFGEAGCKALKGSLSMCNKSSVISEEEVSDQLLLGLCVGLKSTEIEEVAIEAIADINAIIVVVVVVVDPTPPTCCQQSPAPESCGSQQSLPPGGKERLHFVGIRPEVQWAGEVDAICRSISNRAKRPRAGCILRSMLSSSLRSSVACLSIMLKKMEKRVGARTQPCFTPLLIAKGSERSPLSLTWPRWSSCS